MSFQRLPDHELEALSDDELIAYIAAARSAGQNEHSRRALMVLVQGYEANVRRRLLLKVPVHLVEDLARDVIVRAIASAFDGRSMGEFRSWLHTILDRTVADHYRRAERAPRQVPLRGEHGEDLPSGVEPAVASPAGEVETRIVVEKLLESCNGVHGEVVRLHLLEGYRASEVCEMIEGMTVANVHQIASRFRAELRRHLDPEPSPSA